MTDTLNSAEKSQLLQTIEMFEVITQSQPNDYQSLEILKEAYEKLGREKEAIQSSKRIAEAYVSLGQLSLAILEFEMILQRCPEDKEVQMALAKLENKTNLGGGESAADHETTIKERQKETAKPAAEPADDGRQAMFKLFVDLKTISAAEFEASWIKSISYVPGKVTDPFIQVLAEKGSLPIDKSLKILSDRTRLAYLPVERYEVDGELVRSFGREVCQRYCIVPLDRMGKSVLVATCNPFNKDAVRQIEKITSHRLLWYLSPPNDIARTLNKIFR